MTSKEFDVLKSLELAEKAAASNGGMLREGVSTKDVRAQAVGAAVQMAPRDIGGALTRLAGGGRKFVRRAAGDGGAVGYQRTARGRVVTEG